jgi:hypothetical protein
VSLCLQQIDNEHGTEEANRAIDDFKLERKGYAKQ